MRTLPGKIGKARKTGHRLLTLALALLMCLALIPTAVFAIDGEALPLESTLEATLEEKDDTSALPTQPVLEETKDESAEGAGETSIISVPITVAEDTATVDTETSATSAISAPREAVGEGVPSAVSVSKASLSAQSGDDDPAVDAVGFITAEEDVMPPTVVSITPMSGGAAAFSGNIAVNFSEAMDPDDGVVELQQSGLPDAPSIVLTDGVWSYGNTTLTLPYRTLAPNTIYTVRVYNFRDAAGNLLSEEVVSHSFSTAAPDTTLPAVTSISPTGTDAPLSGSVTITFSETVWDASIHGTVALITKGANGTTIPLAPAWPYSSGTTTVSFSYAGLAPGTQYWVGASDFVDAAGNEMDSWETELPAFTTRMQSGDATLASVAGQDLVPTGGTGGNENPYTASVTVPNSKEAIETSDFFPADSNATLAFDSDLPLGLTAGVPATIGVEVTAENGKNVSFYVLTITRQEIVYTVLAQGTTGNHYTARVTVNPSDFGGGADSVGLASGSLPNGLSGNFSAPDGFSITGYPVRAGTYEFGLSAFEGGSPFEGVIWYRITIVPAIHGFVDGTDSYTKGSGIALVHITEKELVTHNGLVFATRAGDPTLDVEDMLTHGTHYSAEHGSTKITLSPGYLDTLPAGWHWLTVGFNDEDDLVQDRFYVAEATPLDDEVSGDDESLRMSGALPQTGDTGGMLGWTAVPLAFVLGVLCLCIWHRRRPAQRTLRHQ